MWAELVQAWQNGMLYPKIMTVVMLTSPLWFGLLAWVCDRLDFDVDER